MVGSEMCVGIWWHALAAMPGMVKECCMNKKEQKGIR
jgi:hypothetical protein